MSSAGNSYFVYIVASPSRTIYIGITNDLARRVHEHQTKEIPGFTATYHVSRLVWFEEFADVTRAIAREKQVKGWRREKKIGLIESMNPAWNDLSSEWNANFKHRGPSAEPALSGVERARDDRSGEQ
jgi:putative endonuclease